MDAMTALIIVYAAVFGLVIGSFLNVVAYRVPAGISLMRESRCPECGAPVRWYQNVPVVSWLALHGRCANCRGEIAVRYPVVEAVTGGAFAAVAWWAVSRGWEAATGRLANWEWVVLVAYLFFASISVVLTLIDLDVHRLPNTIVLPAYPVLFGLFTIACVMGADWENILRAAVGGAGLYVFYAIIRLISPRGMGGGDVKLAGVVGLALGWVGWGALAVGAFAAFVLGGAFGVALILGRRAGRKTAIPFGPWMLVGAWVGIFAGEWLSGVYLGLYG